MHPDLQRSRPRPSAAAHRTALIIGLVSVLAACATPQQGPSTEPPPLRPGTAAAGPATPADGPTTPPPVPAPPPAAPPPATAPANGPPSAATTPLAAALAYADRLRTLSTPELAAEQALIGEPGPSAERQMQLALVLAQSHIPADTARALALLQRLSSSSAPDAAELRPLARLLTGRLLEARRLEDQAERLGQQLRDAQRRIEVLNDRLEAMRAIERSLTPRAPAPGGPRPMP